MGGFVAQKYLEKHYAPAGVLMASMPSRSVRRAREHFFCDSTPESVVVACAQRLQAESHHGGGLRVRIRHAQVTTPLLVLGAEEDRAVSCHAVRTTARDYGTKAEMFAGMGHNMMLEPGWPLVAARIQSWLAGLGP